MRDTDIIIEILGRKGGGLGGWPYFTVLLAVKMLHLDVEMFYFCCF